MINKLSEDFLSFLTKKYRCIQCMPSKSQLFVQNMHDEIHLLKVELGSLQ